MSDPFVGRLTYLRVYSGSIGTGSNIINATKDRKERLGRLLMMHANHREDVDGVSAGDIVAAVGLKSTTTGDTLTDSADPVILERMTFPEPVIEIAIEPKTKQDQEKLATALQRLSDEDPTFRVHTDEETGADADRRHGRAAPRDHRGPPDARVRRGRQRRPAAGRLPRDDPQGRPEGGGPLRPPDRRPRPVRPRLPVGRAQRGRRRLPLREQDRRRLDPQGVHPGGRRGRQGGARGRRRRRLPDGGRQGPAGRRLVPRGGLLGDRLQDRRLDGGQGGRARAPPRPCSSR